MQGNRHSYTESVLFQQMFYQSIFTSIKFATNDLTPKAALHIRATPRGHLERPLLMLHTYMFRKQRTNSCTSINFLKWECKIKFLGHFLSVL